MPNRQIDVAIFMNKHCGNTNKADDKQHYSSKLENQNAHIVLESDRKEVIDQLSVSEDVLESLLREYIGECSEISPWTIKRPSISGRGVFATRDLQPGDIVFRDVPLVVGPRSGSSCPPVCVGCHKGDDSALTGCSRGCGLPVCSTSCESHPRHRSECQLLQRPGRAEWSERLLRALTPIRCLLLPAKEKKLLLCLQAHTHPQHAFEVEYIKGELCLSSPEENFLVRACCTLDSNAFRASISLRGLYPLGSLLNHQCTPNTRHGYDSTGKLVVRAAVFIPAGTEITNSYTSLLWSTQARRHSLAFTKHFACTCHRCQDPKEMGTYLGALSCANDGCAGALLSTDPLRASSKCQCDTCGLTLPGRQATIIQNTLGNLLRIIDQKDPKQVARFLQNQEGALPPSNQVVIDMKTTLVNLYGHCTGYEWADLTDTMLTHKEELCRELLELVDRLGAGQCNLRGVFLYELHCTLVEKLRRLPGTASDMKHIKQEALHAVQEAADIFQDDETAPRDIRQRLDKVFEEKNTSASS